MTRTEMTEPELEELADRAAPLDALLVDAALGPMRLAACRAAEALVDDAGLDWRDDRRVRFLAELGDGGLPPLIDAPGTYVFDT
jgi:hypothetical protein